MVSLSVNKGTFPRKATFYWGWGGKMEHFEGWGVMHPPHCIKNIVRNNVENSFTNTHI